LKTIARLHNWLCMRTGNRGVCSNLIAYWLMSLYVYCLYRPESKLTFACSVWMSVAHSEFDVSQIVSFCCVDVTFVRLKYVVFTWWSHWTRCVLECVVSCHCLSSLHFHRFSTFILLQFCYSVISWKKNSKMAEFCCGIYTTTGV